MVSLQHTYIQKEFQSAYRCGLSDLHPGKQSVEYSIYNLCHLLVCWKIFGLFIFLFFPHKDQFTVRSFFYFFICMDPVQQSRANDRELWEQIKCQELTLISEQGNTC